MTTKSLEDAMSACGVEPVIASQLVQMGWTVQTFACAAVNLEAFDRLWPEFFSGGRTLTAAESFPEGGIQDVSRNDTTCINQ